jgi:hypothetical protein
LPEKQLVRHSVICPAPIWNLLPAPEQPWVVMELRDEAKREVSFSLWDYQAQRFLWQNRVLPEKWWITLSGVDTERAWLKVYESTDNPDVISFQALHLKTGFVEEADVSNLSFPDTNILVRPFQYLDEEEEFASVKEFLKRRLHANAMIGCEYLESGEHVFISFYEGAPARYVNRLAAFSKEGRCFFDEEIGTNLRGIGWNTFFIAAGTLFFVKNRTELVTFRIV